MGSAVSDHCPLLLDLNTDIAVGKRFHFEAFWPNAEGFSETVEVAWHSVPVMRNAFVALDNKLRATSKALQRWSDRWIGNVKLQTLIALEVIERLDKAMDSREISRGEHGLRKLLKQKLVGLPSLQRTIARLRSWMLQLKEGEANMTYFHRQACHQQRKNAILSLQSNGHVLTGQDKITAAVDGYYLRLFRLASERAYALHMETLGLPVRDLAHLEAPFSCEEVEKIIKGMPLDKAPGPDGFTG